MIAGSTMNENEMTQTTCEWTRTLTDELIGEYELYPCLWNVHNHEYRDRIRKVEAWKKIAGKFKMEVKEVQRKIHNLRTQFHNELKKQKKN